VASYALVVVLTVELAVWGCFLVAARPFGQPLPVAALVAVVGNTAVGLAGARVLGRRLGAVVPAVLWLGIALTLGSARPEGDRVVTETFRGLAFLFAGTVAAAAAVALSGARHGTGASPGASGGR
jgi:hypothetical protein